MKFWILVGLLLSGEAWAESFAQFVPPNVKIAKAEQRPSADAVIRHAATFLGVKYVWGSCEIPPGLDCSGFMIKVWSDMGYGLPRVSRHQALVGQAIAPEQLQPADLLFFTRDAGGSEISHVGMYIGNGEFIHAAMGSGRVSINALTGYFKSHYSHARRIIHLGPGLVVERDQSVAIKDNRNLPGKVKAKSPSSQPSSLPVVVDGMVIADEALASQLRSVDLDDPNQFEHAGEEHSLTLALSDDDFAGAAALVGPRFLTRSEHTVSLRTGIAPSLDGPAFYLSPELNLYFERLNLQLTFGFPVPYAWIPPNGNVQAGFKWGSRTGDWRDYTRMVRILRFGESESPLHAELSRTANATLGNGQLVRTLSPGLAGAYLPGAEFGHHPLTWIGEASLQFLTVQTMVDDVLNPHLVGAHVAYKPFVQSLDNIPRVLRELSFGAQYAALFNTFADGSVAHQFAGEVATSVWHTSVHDTSLYVGGAGAVTTGVAGQVQMAKATLGSLWRFRFGDGRGHAFRVRVEGFAGRAHDAFVDNFVYGEQSLVRSPLKAGARFELAYKFREMVEIGGSFVPSFGAGNAYDPLQRADKIEGFLALHSLTLHPSFRLTSQLIYQGLIFAQSNVGNLHYLLADFQAQIVRYLVAGFMIRKPLYFEAAGTNFSRFDFLIQVGGELSF